MLGCTPVLYSKFYDVIGLTSGSFWSFSICCELTSPARSTDPSVNAINLAYFMYPRTLQIIPQLLFGFSFTLCHIFELSHTKFHVLMANLADFLRWLALCWPQCCGDSKQYGTSLQDNVFWSLMGLLIPWSSISDFHIPFHFIWHSPVIPWIFMLYGIKGPTKFCCFLQMEWATAVNDNLYDSESMRELRFHLLLWLDRLSNCLIVGWHNFFPRLMLMASICLLL